MLRLSSLLVLTLVGCVATGVDEPTRSALWSIGRLCQDQVHGTVRFHEVDQYGRLRFSYRWENERAAFQRCVGEHVAERFPRAQR